MAFDVTPSSGPHADVYGAFTTINLQIDRYTAVIKPSGADVTPQEGGMHVRQ